MRLDLTTPALLFPAISLLLLAYTSRFLTLATLIRELHKRYLEGEGAAVLGQISNLRRRVQLIRAMQALGVLSFFGCVFSMFLLFIGAETLGQGVFGLSLLLLMVSLALSVWEIQMSVGALDLQLQDLEDEEGRLHRRPRKRTPRSRARR
ncbi:DUF2721 domain-containing protein [Truepera radiovictrix]|uniref:II family cellulose-binding protein n=1 Tax=Truepera radiovictrix (strain DSM 17093 / CIP 108686 / LMG 22925 / RQ-24) TaxID=649638 RepID=D7CR46_TRURR|nr:DUF2721 domain-containing protein [Truepera radiovictrix]ADI13446.1 conserved hypothetical protein [Truepera radiovictrix DSM 17093]WMT57994.1 DUF2721 domain-containing protein [Truepera radiovictrix]